MQRIILLRFHKDIALTQNRIDLLKQFNPDTRIYGLFGGAQEDLDEFEKSLRGLEKVTFLHISDKDIKWRFSDYAILQWYQEVGKTIDFDIVHVIEYDLVLLESLEKLYPYKDNEHHIYLTSLLELDKMKPIWNWFQNPQFPVAECKEFERLMKEDYKIPTLYGSMAPGTTLTKKYLEGYSRLDLPLIAFDEMRLPAISQILGIEMRDTDFVKDWFDESDLDFRLFNTDNHEVDQTEMLQAYKSSYQKAFHPVYYPLDLTLL